MEYFTELSNSSQKRKCAYVRADTESAWEYAAWVLATGRDYFTGEKTLQSEKDRMEFKQEFPACADYSYFRLRLTADEKKRDIIEWYFSGNWLKISTASNSENVLT